MKPDREGMYALLTQYKILKIKSFNNTEFNRMFKGQAQTPCSFVLMQKTKISEACGSFEIYDQSLKTYVPFILQPNMPIPVFGVSILNKLYPFVKKVGCLHVEKTNIYGRHVLLSDNHSVELFPYKNIKTCLLMGDIGGTTLKNIPVLQYVYSNTKCPYFGISKIVMAHGMYGFPYIDNDGLYGVANRDKYVILHKTYEEMIQLSSFLSSKTAMYLFEATKYRMKILEKYIFQYLPDITKLHDFPVVINDDTLAVYFGFSEQEKLSILSQNKKKYHQCRETRP